ncbi:protein NO VEIN domain-containing protein [Marasmitruncus massiliensis]|uniref:protein NO VEIN domain-containing protein n=1 Tax=Marasmitruncus massiliensis TaxID=1944642 RepID=UPI000C7A2D6A|nr:DUF3883 domain-containing protein [Marasmitruncus massiliensis]
MTRASLGMFSAVLSLLDQISKLQLQTAIQIKEYAYISNANAKDVIELALNCEWIILNEKTSNITITEDGNLLKASFNENQLTMDLLRRMLMTYSLKCRPAWVYRVPSGRREASIFMSNDERRCFLEALLLSDDITESCILWWDNLAECIRYQRGVEVLETGRKGEYESIIFEHKRTAFKPIWESIETNLTGYDIISVVSPSNHDRLLIEVKASSLPIGKAVLRLSKNEWNTATSAKHFQFHLWSFSSAKKLCILSVDEMSKHIPKNHGRGNWQEVIVPFSAFCNFIEIL